MKQIVVISGKGGTGKTVLTASFAALAKNKVMADCDVDAADLHLLLTPTIRESQSFKSGYTAVVDKNLCTNCGKCKELCRFDAISKDFNVDSVSCEGCAFCSHVCPVGAIKMEENTTGEWFVSDTRFGEMVHAKLGIAEENSGKLVSLVRSKAKKIAEELGCGKNSIINAIKRLEFWNIISKQRVGKKINNRYLLFHKKHWKPVSEVCLKEYSEVCDIKFKSLSDKLHKFTTQTSIVRSYNIKETHSKETKKHLTSEELTFKRKIDETIDKFKKINPSYRKFFSNTTQRKALQRLVEQHGEEKIIQFLEVIPITNKMQYAPSITTPLQLEDKLASLSNFIQKEKINNKPNIAII